MIKRGVATHVDELARMFAAAPRVIQFRGVSTGRELLQSYFSSLEECAEKNGCALCRRELERAAAEVATNDKPAF